MSEERGEAACRTTGVSFEVLGRLRVCTGGAELPLPPGQLRWLLAVLLLRDGSTAPEGLLMRHAWGPGLASRAALRTAASRLRAWLARVDSSLAHTGDGYRLRTPPLSIDAARFRRALSGAAGIADDGARFAQLQDGLSACPGPPLSDAPEWVLDDPALAELVSLRRRGILDFAVLARGTGRPDAAVTHLAQLCTESPHDEPVHSEYLRLLAACGRPAQALLHYGALRTRLRDDLGTDPSQEAQACYQAVLSMDAQPPAVAPAPPRAPRPAQLPLDNSRFAGRRAQLEQLDAALAGPRTSTTVCAIFGTAGIGKTTLAVHWARQVRHQFPDGQLYCDLRGFDPSGAPLHPAEAIGGFLDALAGGGKTFPAGLDAQVGLYRSLVAERRILVLLDNADDVGQVLPLLPGGPGSLAIVTSRHQLTGLVATQGAQPVSLDLMPFTDARELLSRRLGPARVAADQAAADEIIARCGQLPVALAVVAARAATNPARPLAELAEDLASGFDGLHDGDPSNDTRAIFSWSYRALSPPAARLFRLLATHPGPDAPIAAAASMCGLGIAETRPLLAELVHASLLTVQLRRYTMHDLLRRYGMELAQSVDGPQAARSALHRVLRHYLRTAHAAHLRLYGPARLLPLPPADDDGTGDGNGPVEFGDDAAAAAWFSAEYNVILSAVPAAAAAGLHSCAWRLASAMFLYWETHARWHDLAASGEIAVQAACLDEPPGAVARIRRELANAYGFLGRRQDAAAQLRVVLDIAEQAHDLKAQGDAHRGLAIMAGKARDFGTALRHAQHSISCHQASGDAVGEARSLNAAGYYHSMLLDPGQALLCCRAAITIQHRAGVPEHEADSWDSLGCAYYQLGRTSEAITAFERGIELFAATGNRIGLAEALSRLAEIQEAVNAELASGTRQRARSILDELGITECDSQLPGVIRPDALMTAGSPRSADPEDVEDTDHAGRVIHPE